jgi:hypothetical protein
MKKLPYKLNASNAKNFQKLKIQDILRKIRLSLYNFLVSREAETEYYDFDQFFLLSKLTEDEKDFIRATIIKELENLDWNTKLSFGGSGLYIYSTDEPPHTYVDFEVIE